MGIRRLTNEPAIIQATTLGVFLSFALLFVVRSGYSYGAAVLFFASLYGLYSQRDRTLHGDDRLLAGVLFLYFAAFVISTTLLGNPWRDLDQPLRALLCIPILMLVVRTPFRVDAIWAGVVVGVVGSAGIAYWQVVILGVDRAEGYLNIIHFGNIALVFGTFCIAGAYYMSDRPNRWLWWGAFGIGLLCSFYSIISSGSRASWVAIPVVLVLCAIAFGNRHNMKLLATGIFTFLVGVAVLFNLPDSPLKERYDAAVSDIVLLMDRGEADTSLGARIVMWEGAVRTIAIKPISGWNLAEYDAEIQRQVAAGDVDAVALKFTNNLHNAYLQAYAFQGLLGLIALLLFFAAPLYAFGKRLRNPSPQVRAFAFAGASLAACYVIFSLTQVIVARNNGIMFYLIGTATLWGALRQLESGPPLPTHAQPPFFSTIRTPSSSS